MVSLGVSRALTRERAVFNSSNLPCSLFSREVVFWYFAIPSIRDGMLAWSQGDVAMLSIGEDMIAMFSLGGV